MAVINPPFAMQNAGATHTARGDRLMLASLFAREFADTEDLRIFGGVNKSVGGILWVHQTTTPSMGIGIKSGMCIVGGSNIGTQGAYACINDGPITRSITTAHGTLPRIDSVFATVADSEYSGAVNTWDIQVIAGTPASSPVRPVLPGNSLRLADVTVGAAVSSIVDGNIDNTVKPGLAAVGGILAEPSFPDINTVQEGQAVWRTDLGNLYFKHSGAYVLRGSSTVTQTGVASVTFTNKNSHTQNINFPTAFASIPRVMTNINTGSGNTSRWATRAFNITTTGFTLWAYYASDSSTTESWTNVEVQYNATA